MFSFMSPKQSPEAPKLGINLPDDNKVAAVELKDIADKYRKRTEQIDQQIKKANKDRELSKKLAASYIHNYYVMIDISSLLNQYAEFFQSIKEMLAKSDVQLEQLNAQSFQDLEKLTRQEMDKFTYKFSEQAEKVRKLFLNYNMQDQAAKLTAVPQLTSQVSAAADNAAALRRVGGSKKHLKKNDKSISNGRRQHQKKKGSET